MGIVEQLHGDRLYLGTNVYIYAQEQVKPFAAQLAALFAEVDAGRLHAVASELTLGECLVKPLLDGDVELVDIYKRVLVTSEALTVAPMSRSIVIRAAELRSEHRLRFPDAIHLATALAERCATFITNDRRLPDGGDLAMLVLGELQQ